MQMIEQAAIAAMSDAELEALMDQVGAELEANPKDRTAQAMFVRIGDVVEREARGGR